MGYYFSPYYSHGPEHSFERYSLHAGIARLSNPPGRPGGRYRRPRSPGGRYHRRAVSGRGGAGPVPSLHLPGGPRIGEGTQGWAPLHAGPRPWKRPSLWTTAPISGSPIRTVSIGNCCGMSGAVRIQWGEVIGRSRRDDAAVRPARPLAGAFLGARLAIDGQLVRRLWASRGRELEHSPRACRPEGKSWPGRWAAWPAPATTGTT